MLQPLITRYAGAVSLRLGHIAALTVHRTVIHYRDAASLPQGEASCLCRGDSPLNSNLSVRVGNKKVPNPFKDSGRKNSFRGTTRILTLQRNTKPTLCLTYNGVDPCGAIRRGTTLTSQAPKGNALILSHIRSRMSPPRVPEGEESAR